MMYSRKLHEHEYAQAQVNYLDDGTIILQSYNTYVIIVDPEGWLKCTGIYSRTTIKHIGWFMRELYGLSYYDAKRCWEDNKLFNVHTGEYIERD